MTAIAAAVADILAHPAPVILPDTCNFLDLFRRDDERRPRVGVDEIQAAAELLPLFAARPRAAHLIVPELIPGEFADHANGIEKTFEGWLHSLGQYQRWLAEVAPWIDVDLPESLRVELLGISTGLRKLADNLLAEAVVLERDASCLDRAVARLIAKRRPSQNKEMKDSMNLEQVLELSRRLTAASFEPARIFISSNTNDFAQTAKSATLHPDLAAEFAAAGLEYYTSFRAAVRSLRTRAQLP